MMPTAKVVVMATPTWHLRTSSLESSVKGVVAVSMVRLPLVTLEANLSQSALFTATPIIKLTTANVPAEVVAHPEVMIF